MPEWEWSDAGRLAPIDRTVALTQTPWGVVAGSSWWSLTCIGDEELVLGGAVGGLGELGALDVQPQVLQGSHLQGGGGEGRSCWVHWEIVASPRVSPPSAWVQSILF